MGAANSTHRSQLVNAFLPSSGVDDPHRFAGRREQVRELANALVTNGTVPLIYGHRGLGKSSLALQLSRIAQGDTELLSQMDLSHMALPEDGRYISLYVTCSDSTSDTRAIIQRMINAINTLKSEADERNSSRLRLADRSTKASVSLKVFSAEVTNRYEERKNSLDTTGFSAEEILIHQVEVLADVYQQKVVFILDEIDRVSDTTGLASFLKSYSNDFLKFVLVGIGTTEGDLLGDHASLSRQLTPVRVGPMLPIELKSIIERIEQYLAAHGFDFTFSDSAKEEIVRIAAGFPWFVHLIGQASLLEAENTHRLLIELSDVKHVVSEFPKNRLAKQYNDRYVKAVGDSMPREAVLRLFAEWNDENIPTSEIYPRAQSFTSSPSQYVGHLASDRYGSIIVSVVNMSRMYRFSDEMFKTYIRMRSSVYIGIDAEVRRKFSSLTP